MKKISFALLMFIGFAIAAQGQYANVQYDLEKNYFNEGQVLPAEKNLIFSGLIPENIDLIMIHILSHKSDQNQEALYTAFWKNLDNKQQTNFSIAINYPLKSSRKYDFQIDYYRPINASEKKELLSRILSMGRSYLSSQLEIDEDEIEVTAREKKIFRHLEQMVKDVLKDYQNQDGRHFEGFSSAMLELLKQTDDVKLQKDSSLSKEAQLKAKVEEILTSMDVELQLVFEKSWSKLSLSRYVDNYETEKKKGVFAFNVGYGGVYLDGNLDNFSYDAAPYIGLALPLGDSKFLRNASFNLGAFLENFEDEAGNTISGFLVNRPLYAGLDYKIFEFIRFNAGAAFLEKEKIELGGTTESTVLIRPYVGLSARINLSIGFGK